LAAGCAFAKKPKKANTTVKQLVLTSEFVDIQFAFGFYEYGWGISALMFKRSYEIFIIFFSDNFSPQGRRIGRN
jgi:hypothetical protein